MLAHPWKGLALPLYPLGAAIGSLCPVSTLVLGAMGVFFKSDKFHNLIYREGILMKKVKPYDQYEGLVTGSGHTASLPHWSTSEWGQTWGLGHTKELVQM